MSALNLRLPEQNNVTLVGRLTHDPEVRFTAKGMAICRFSIAVNRRYKNNSTCEWMDDTSFVPVVVWGDAANRCGERLKKGYPVYVEGRLQSRQWETKEGQKRTTIEVNSRRVQFLARTEVGAGSDDGGEMDAASAGAVPNMPGEDDIPF